MPQIHTLEFKNKIVHRYLGEGRAYKGITVGYGLYKASISRWGTEFGKEY